MQVTHSANMRTFISMLLFFPATNSVVAQQSFSCNYGSRGACLGYNDKIVDRGASCFNEFTCDFKGFICKAKFDDVVEEHDALVTKYNELLRRNREVADAAREIVDKNAALTTEYNELLGKFRRLALDYETQGAALRSANDHTMQLTATIRSLSNKTEQMPTKKKP